MARLPPTMPSCSACFGAGCAACAGEVVSYDAFLEAQADRRAADEDAQLVEVTLWRVTRANYMATARTRLHPVGLELCIFSGDDLVWSRLYTGRQQPLVGDEANDKLTEFLAAGSERVLDSPPMFRPLHFGTPFATVLLRERTMADQDTKRAAQGPTSADTRSTQPQGTAIEETDGNARDREMGREGPPLGDLGHGERTWAPPAGEQGISNRPDDAGTSGQRSSTMTQDVKKQGDGQKQGGQQSGQREGGGSQQGFAEQQSSQRRDEGDKDDQSPGRQREGQQGGGGQQGDSQTSGKSGGNKQGGSGGSQNKGDNDNKGGGQSGSKGSGDRNA